MSSKLELLAPAGSLDTFEAAVLHGADAVYVGAPEANARALAKSLTFEEIAAMVAFAHQRKVKVYVAMNSLIKDSELPKIVEMVSVLSDLGVDALIIQDLGLHTLIKKYFPALRVHASTLMGAHNSLAVKQFAVMGFSRVVLAREMRIDEIASVRAASNVELEVFVHGAMCFAYSGMCLFSSFLGGKSGLRGRCVQPCRRRYSWKGAPKGKSQSGYFFSMNDLEGITLLEQLQAAGITSLKIEGRMRNRHYVSHVVQAYRLLIDNKGHDPEISAEAQKLLDSAMGRKTSTGYFTEIGDEKLISWQHSGNVGLFLGGVEAVHDSGMGQVTLKENIRLGDKIRIHYEKSGERESVPVREIFAAGKSLQEAQAGAVVALALTAAISVNDSLYKIDSSEARSGGPAKIPMKPGQFKKIVQECRAKPQIAVIKGLVAAQAKKRKPGSPGKKLVKSAGSIRESKKGRHKGPRFEHAADVGIPWWLRLDNLQLLRQLPQKCEPARIVILLSQETYRQLRSIHFSGDMKKKIIWALPPVILESEIAFYYECILWLGRNGFHDWQVSHIGQVQLFYAIAPILENEKNRIAESRRVSAHKPKGKKNFLSRFSGFNLCGHYSLNVYNIFTLMGLKTCGISYAQISIEADQSLVSDIGLKKTLPAGMTVFGFPQLFISRLAPSVYRYGHTMVSPKGEEFVLGKSGEQTVALPMKPFSLLHFRSQIAESGIDFVVVDLVGGHYKKADFLTLLKSVCTDKKQRFAAAGSTFNYRGTLL